MAFTTGSDPSPRRLSVAVIGAGITGLSAAWLLGRRHDVTLFEKDGRLGGHANTVTVHAGDAPTPVDTGFIVYNERNYPNLTALFAALNVPTRPSDMSFGVHLKQSGVEYSSNDLAAFLAGGRNLASPRFWSMTAGVLRFYRNAAADLRDAPDDLTLGEYLASRRYSAAFQNDHLLPEAAAIWSSSQEDMRSYPARAFIRFFENHGLLRLTDRPAWRTVVGGSQTYVAAVRAAISARIHTGAAITSVRPISSGVEVITQAGQTYRFDRVLIAAHADQALRMLAAPDLDQRAILGAIAYRPNAAILHTDAAHMPARRSLWSSWNYVGDARDAKQGCAVTYWMNRLQGLQTREPLFVTLNPARPIAADRILWEGSYDHPCFTPQALAAQRRLPAIQGRAGLWFAGAWAGSGFHEDGVSAGLAAAEEIGAIMRPWKDGAGAEPPLAEAA